MATFEETYQKYNDNRTNAINDMYDAQKQNQLAQLEDAYKQNVQSQEQAISKIDPAYQQKANDLAAQYERNRRNFNQQAAGNGLNTGTASQAALAQNSAYQRDMGNLRTAQADAMNEAQQRLASLEQQYKSSVAQAIASNDYDRAKALMNEYNNQENRDRSTAQTLASYGDFSGYERLYGSDVANNMSALWKAQNPGLAYNTGRMTAEEYKAITGKYPAGYTAPVRYSYRPVTPTGENEITDTGLTEPTMADYTKMLEDERAAAARAINGATSQADMLARQSGYQRGDPGYEAFVQTYLSGNPAYAQAKAKQAELDSAYYSGTTKGQQTQAQSSALTAAQEAKRAAQAEAAQKKKIDDFWDSLSNVINNSANVGWYGGG